MWEKHDYPVKAIGVNIDDKDAATVPIRVRKELRKASSSTRVVTPFVFAAACNGASSRSSK